jgi:hypothetical protein
MAQKVVTPQQNYLHMKLREKHEEIEQLKEELNTKNKAAQNPSMIAKAEGDSPTGDSTYSLDDYEPCKDMGMDWYTKRIMHLVDQNNHLTDLLKAHENTRT